MRQIRIFIATLHNNLLVSLYFIRKTKSEIIPQMQHSIHLISAPDLADALTHRFYFITSYFSFLSRQNEANPWCVKRQTY